AAAATDGNDRRESGKEERMRERESNAERSFSVRTEVFPRYERLMCIVVHSANNSRLHNRGTMMPML
ncbi:MAG TPA: hypothetical protein VLB83_03545, partial [Candidatus Paceibacterota bacterium]|nr:hypothetical protein [Candidatus Paceibacterota bacterium]